MDIPLEEDTGSDSDQVNDSFVLQEENGNQHETSTNPLITVTTLKPRRASSKGENVCFLQSNKQRLQTAKQSGKNIKEKCEALHKKTGGKVEFFYEYSSPKTTVTYRFGQSTTVEPEPEKENITDIIVKTMREEFQPMHEVIKSISISLPAQQSDQFSPTKQKLGSSRSSAARKVCCICKGNTDSVVMDHQAYESVLINCSGPNCNYYIHADCLGFPGQQPGVSKSFPDFYCTRHVAEGRARLKVKHHYLDPRNQPAKRGRQE